MDQPGRSAAYVMGLLAAGVPLALMCDLLDPDGLRTALAAELLAGDVALSPAPEAGSRRRLRSA